MHSNPIKLHLKQGYDDMSVSMKYRFFNSLVLDLAWLSVVYMVIQ